MCKDCRVILYKLISFFTECVAPEDCPNGGINFKCIANECECPNPFVLDADKKCVGMVKILFVVLRGHPKMTQKEILVRVNSTEFCNLAYDLLTTV